MCGIMEDVPNTFNFIVKGLQSSAAESTFTHAQASMLHLANQLVFPKF
jgi:hypothetical protein